MKKVLFATTALVLTAGTAMAEVKFGGAARVGLEYVKDRGGVNPAVNDTQVNMRLRFNIDAYKETDAGVTFGGRIRIQYDQGRTQDNSSEGGAELSAAYVYAEANGFHVEVGNVNTAFDSTGGLYASEIGYIGQTFGGADASGYNYQSFSTSPYSAGQANRMGVFASYTVGDLVARLSYITPDQNTGTGEDELSVSFDYKVGAISFAAGYAQNGDFVTDNDLFALTGEYAINDSTNVGLQIVGYKDLGNALASETTVTLYGNSTLASGITLAGYIASDSKNSNLDDFAIGVGASYDLGGATLAGHIEKGFNDETRASLGVNFSF